MDERCYISYMITLMNTLRRFEKESTDFEWSIVRDKLTFVHKIIIIEFCVLVLFYSNWWAVSDMAT
jgi:hypothetical protein